MGKVLTAEEMLSRLEEIRNERYRSIWMWIREMKQSSDLGRVQALLPGLEKYVFQCETLDGLLHDLYVGIRQVSEGEVE